MKQQLEDIKTILKSDRRIMAAAGFIAVALLFWLITGSDSGRRRTDRARMVPSQSTASPQGSSAQELGNNLIEAFQQDIKQLKTDRREITDLLERTREDQAQYKERVTGIFETLVDKFEQLAREVDTLSNTVKGQGGGITPPERTTPDEPAKLTKVWEEDEGPTVTPQPIEVPTRVSVIAPGDAVQVRLLTGVNAPVDGTPYPVIFELAGPVSGPDGSSLDLGSARIIAAAQGSEADGRALFRLTQLSIRHPSGRRSVVEIDGWIVGEDGIRGMGGRLLDKLGRLIFTTAWVSGLSALGERIDESTVVVDRDGRPLALDSRDVETAAASALSDASNRLGQALLNRYESLVPVVEVLSGREVVAVFSKPAEIELINDGAVFASAPGR